MAVEGGDSGDSGVMARTTNKTAASASSSQSVDVSVRRAEDTPSSSRCRV